jgi:hypothetical protein
MHSTAALVANEKIIISFQPLMPDFLSAVRFVGVLAASLTPDHQTWLSVIQSQIELNNSLFQGWHRRPNLHY